MPLDRQIITCIIGVLWLILAAYWAINVVGNKRSVYRQPRLERLAYFVGFLVVIFAIVHTPQLAIPLLRRTWITQTAGLILCGGGVAFAIWARRVLGTNWSGIVTLKENHELIRRGPYKIVRHPIYTGIILATIGNVLAALPNLQGALCVVAVFVGLRLKSVQEEKVLLKQFPLDYPQYQREVKALVPFAY